MAKVDWKTEPDPHDYPAAAGHLSRLADDAGTVERMVAAVGKGKPVSPVLVRGDLARGFPLQVADGYHRVCASCRTAEATDIPSRLVVLPTPLSGSAMGSRSPRGQRANTSAASP